MNNKISMRDMMEKFIDKVNETCTQLQAIKLTSEELLKQMLLQDIDITITVNERVQSILSIESALSIPSSFPFESPVQSIVSILQDENLTALYTTSVESAMSLILDEVEKLVLAPDNSKSLSENDLSELNHDTVLSESDNEIKSRVSLLLIDEDDLITEIITDVVNSTESLTLDEIIISHDTICDDKSNKSSTREKNNSSIAVTLTQIGIENDTTNDNKVEFPLDDTILDESNEGVWDDQTEVISILNESMHSASNHHEESLTYSHLPSFYDKEESIELSTENTISDANSIKSWEIYNLRNCEIVLERIENTKGYRHIMSNSNVNDEDAQFENLFNIDETISRSSKKKKKSKSKKKKAQLNEDTLSQMSNVSYDSDEVCSQPDDSRSMLENLDENQLLEEIRSRVKLDSLLTQIIDGSCSDYDSDISSSDDEHTQIEIENTQNDDVPTHEIVKPIQSTNDVEDTSSIGCIDEDTTVEPLLSIPIEGRSSPYNTRSKSSHKRHRSSSSSIILCSSEDEHVSFRNKTNNDLKKFKLNDVTNRKRIHSNSSSNPSDIENILAPKRNQTFKISLPKCIDNLSVVKSVILDYDKDTKKSLIDVDPEFLKYLRPHQIEGIRFMWDCCFESVEKIFNDKGRGCILSHCMGLGKTLQVIVFLNSIMRYADVTHTTHALILVPKNTIKNWMEEFYKWQLCLLSSDDHLEIFELSDSVQIKGRLSLIKQWRSTRHKSVLIVGYEQFRCLFVSCEKRNSIDKQDIINAFIDPGPDILICDEGHVLRNNKTYLFKQVNKVKTKRKIIMTGTPLQNSLDEYHCMVSLVNPSLLGHYKTFKHRFIVPINQGMLADSTDADVKLMKKRVHVLHNMLDEVVQRKDYKYLTKIIPPKHEYILSIRPSERQKQLYLLYKETHVKLANLSLFKDFRTFTRILVHPWLCRMHEKLEFTETSSSNSISTNTSEDEDTVDFEKSGSSTTSKENEPKSDKQIETNPSLDWWSSLIQDSDEFANYLSGKIVLSFEIIDKCWANDEKLVIFSQSLLALDYIENLLAHRHHSCRHANRTLPRASRAKDIWISQLDFCRIDGSVSSKNRDKVIKLFNNEHNRRLRLFLISTKAGGVGINLCSANRAIIFDVSWNPSHDIQSIFRLYRIGQTRPVYIYRFVGQGSMEEKIYQRQVNKEGLTLRVCDEHHLERHFTSADLSELYHFNPHPWNPNVERATPVLPKDRMLADMLKMFPEWIVRYHEHDSLLQKDADLTEEERQAAWKEYESEKTQQDEALSETNYYYRQFLSLNSNEVARFPQNTNYHAPIVWNYLQRPPRAVGGKMLMNRPPRPFY